MLSLAVVSVPVEVPEPSSWLLLLTGLVSLAFIVWKHTAQKAE